ncbi:unnamed protein product [Protopolystoma xenopodis]|uniref:Peptidase S1 domain-containing protein n=1 Tax=Protopolystoma xenopodis TaxID=117903 RepID=A0A448XG17_9PLAT|nr:unnamed protein product [Protopolystoma xenopodis]
MLDTGGPGVQRIRVVGVYIYPNYDAQNYINDLALLQLERQLDLGGTSGLKKSVLATDPSMISLLRPGTRCYVAGWGKTQNTGSDEILREAMVPIIDYQICRTWLANLTPASFCAGYEAGGIDACQGDSGGPLICELPGYGMVQTGIVSWGVDCGRPRLPGVYTNLAYFANWFKSVL